MSEKDLPDGGTFGSFPELELDALFVAPATTGEKNTFRFPLPVVACWRLDDIRFEFDSSILKPETRKEMKDLALLRGMNPGAPISIFGHADPIDNEVYNKVLSGRRAAVIYGLVTRDAGIWEKLYKKPFGGDSWKTRALQVMLTAMAFDTKGIDGEHGENTSQAIKAYRNFKGLSPSGADTPETRKLLFADYMDLVCVNAQDMPFKIPKSDFLARNEDPNGKGDYQGCSEFNPVVVFSKELTEEYKRPGFKVARDIANTPNRRVTALFFAPGFYVPPAKWPCPAAKDGVAGCKLRFWAEYKTKLAPAEKTRLFEKTKDTFGCRFYHRLTIDSPCEESAKYWVIRVMEPGYKPIDDRKPIANAPFQLTGENGGAPIVNGVTDANGILRIRASSLKAKLLLKIAGTEIHVNAGELQPSGASEDASRQRLCNLGYGPADYAKWSPDDADAAYRKFQRQHLITVTGAANPATIDKLKKMNGS
jgi:peptidoglycan hydrolase-like protein with peptidoglycan-binding domain